MTNELVRTIIDAAHEQFDEAPRAFYVQKYSDGTWAAEFAEDDTSALEHRMTRWLTGEDAENLHVNCKNASVKLAEITEIANDINDGWDDDWTD